jgi:heat-inducible transcriptional repressor
MSFDSHDDTLNDRAQQLLRTLVEQYIREGQPVGSRSLSRESGMALSAATIRNVMADLEELGFVTSPHTSAGRVPTDKGYRFFVDTLLKVRPLETEAVQIIQQGLVSRSDDPNALVAAASKMLSSITQLAGVVTLPRQEHKELTQIEFLSLSDNRVLAVLVTNGREVQNRVMQLERTYSSEELRRAANYLNQQFAGRDLSTVREQLVAQLKQTREHLNQSMIDAIWLAQQVVASDEARPPMQYVIAGETNLMGFAELSSVEKLRRLFEAFNQQHDVLHLLDQSLRAEGVQIFIGHESGHTIFDDCSVITAPYAIDKEVVGVLGVIGPTRMAYERVIPIVDLTARLLGAALNNKS